MTRTRSNNPRPPPPKIQTKNSAMALGQALSVGCNKSLLSLKLDYNPSLGSEGVAALCRGLRTNSSLKQLHLPYCDLGVDSGAPLGEMLSYSKLQLAVLNLQVGPLIPLCFLTILRSLLYDYHTVSSK